MAAQIAKAILRSAIGSPSGILWLPDRDCQGAAALCIPSQSTERCAQMDMLIRDLLKKME
jgi:hypothetical protein